MIQKRTKFVTKSFLVTLLISISSGANNLMAQIDPTLIGNWSGTVTQGANWTYPANMTINNLVIGQPSGQTDYPTFPCAGSNVFLSNTGNIHVFSETIIGGTGVCANGQVDIYKLSENSIQWDWYDTIFGEVVSGILTRSTSGTVELINTQKELVNIVDFMGRETEFKPNPPLIFIYSDGTRERVMEIEE